jgi:NitT/TauT family transport system ATP-binding protein
MSTPHALPRAPVATTGLPQRAANDGSAPDTDDTGRPLVRIDGVSMVYDNGTEALREVTLQVPQRPQFISLLGPSGCGKSTLLRLIASLEQPSTGEIEWPTSRVTREGKPVGALGFVFQEPTLMPWATVFDNVYLPLRIQGQQRDAVRADIEATLQTVGLGDFMQAYPRELSGGMKMRVSIARALVQKPRVLLMDEPFAALDEITRLKLSNDLLALCRTRQLTVVFVTHSVYESVYLSDRIVVMAARPGRVIADLAVAVGETRDEAYRTSSLYNQHCREVSAWLRQAMEGAPA